MRIAQRAAPFDPKRRGTVQKTRNPGSNNVGGSCDIVKWIAANLPRDTYVNIMSQYRPMYRAFDYPAISRRITRDEYRHVVDCAREAGLINLDLQGFRG